MIDQHFAVLGGAIDLAGAASYAWLTYKGDVRPNLVTWVIWAAAPLIGFAASLSAGVGWNSALTLGIGVGPVLVVLGAVLRRSGYWELVAFDYVCGALSVAALVLWYLTRSAGIAVAFSVGADLLAAAPTITKTYQHPESESVTPYLAGVIASVITLLSLRRAEFVYLAFPLYVLVVSAALTVLAMRKPARLREQSQVS